MAWIVTAAVVFPVLYLAVDFARIVEFDLFFLAVCTAIIGLFVDGVVQEYSLTKTKR